MNLGNDLFNELTLPPGEWSSWSDDEWVCEVCCFCEAENKFTWNIERNVGHCWLCDRWINNINSFVYHYGKDNFGEIDRPEDKPVVYSKASIDFLTSAWEFKQSKEFLIGRNISELTCRQNGILFDPKAHVMFVPTKPITPDLPDSFLWRKLPAGKWYHKKTTKSNYYGFGQEKFANSGKNVLICEGIFDLISSGMESRGMAVLGSSLNQVWYYWFKRHVNKLVLWFDPDPAGYKATLKISEECLFYNIPFSVIKSDKDPKEYNRRKKSDRLFLETLEREIDKKPIENRRNYIIKC